MTISLSVSLSFFFSFSHILFLLLSFCLSFFLSLCRSVALSLCRSLALALSLSSLSFSLSLSPSLSLSTYMIFVRTCKCLTRHCAVALLVLVYVCMHNILVSVYTHNMYTSVDLPMPPGPQSTHLLVVSSPLSNQSRIPFSSLDRRWNPFGALTLNTRIAPTLPLSPRAVGALITCGLRVQKHTLSLAFLHRCWRQAAKHTASTTQRLRLACKTAPLYLLVTPRSTVGSVY